MNEITTHHCPALIPPVTSITYLDVTTILRDTTVHLQVRRCNFTSSIPVTGTGNYVAITAVTITSPATAMLTLPAITIYLFIYYYQNHQ